MNPLPSNESFSADENNEPDRLVKQTLFNNTDNIQNILYNMNQERSHIDMNSNIQDPIHTDIEAELKQSSVTRSIQKYWNKEKIIAIIITYGFKKLLEFAFKTIHKIIFAWVQLS